MMLLYIHEKRKTMAMGDVLVIGSGGREHAFVWKLRQSPFVKSIYVAPGNIGTGYIAHNIDIQVTDLVHLLEFARMQKIDLTIVGPELPLKLGIVDLFQAHNLCIFGSTQEASLVETSKVFGKNLMLHYGIPTAPFHVCMSYQEAFSYIHQRAFPMVIKTDGLAQGKGVYVCSDLPEAKIALQKIMVDRIYGNSGNMVVIEDYLQGKEVSIHALCNKRTRSSLISARDHKTLKEANMGPNTGGMGGYARVPWFTDNHMFHVEHMIIDPLLTALKRRGTPFTGCLFPGVMITDDGPKVIEFNARFGDPETQLLMMLLANDFFLVLKSYASEQSEIAPIFLKNTYAVCVALCSKEYPASNHVPVPIYGLKKAQDLSENIMIFHGSTQIINNQLYSKGGRVLYITAKNDTLDSARTLAYQACELIDFNGQYRKDIGNAVL